jgi:hypothetical protein
MKLDTDISQRIGVVVVHGIGEQRRFEHIDAQVREIVSALRARPNTRVTVDILGARGSAFLAQQDTWATTPTIRARVKEGPSNAITVIDFHEVWWADVNEPYSLSKQLRFWWWALTVWIYPDKPGTTLAPAIAAMRTPDPPGRKALHLWWVRTRLLFVAFVAVLASASVGMLSFFAERVFKLQAPSLIQVFVNYVAGVKLYNQKSRFGTGIPPKTLDFLDTLEEPPRVSVRRRMIRVLGAMAQENYDRWYVLAHSLGSVVAFNGLMEPAYSWPGYYDLEQWNSLAGQLRGPAVLGWVPPVGKALPARPVWADANEVAYRSHIFSRFHGLLTFGSPLEKFATLWPARVLISLEAAFREGTQWLNVYDPIDPISGVLRSFSGGPSKCCPAPTNIGYRSGPVLLLAHIRYLAGPHGRGTLADGVAHWLMTGNSSRIAATAGARWYEPNKSASRVRSVVSWVSWVVAVVILVALGAVVFPTVWHALTSAGRATWQELVVHLPGGT